MGKAFGSTLKEFKKAVQDMSDDAKK
ncbi:twin-arginine translocase TatA/TatE family subunit [Oceanobacillus caeni]